MDTWQGINSDPITLHKYLYANADPVNYTDPTGNFGLGSFGAASTISGILTTINVGSSAYSLFQIATGDKELSAREIGSEILIGLLTRGLGNHVSKIKNLVPARVRKQIEDCFNNSFVEGSLVSVPGGFKSIEQIKIGDLVLSYNESTGQNELQEVSHLIQGKDDKEVLQIALSTGAVIEATVDHPFFSNNEWTDAGSLDVGSTLKLSDGKSVTVQNVSTVVSSRKVFNLSVANTHTFYVGRDAVLAHNTNIICRLGGVTLQRPLRSADLGLSGNVKLLRGNLLLGNGKATYQIDFVESAKAGSINFRRVLEAMKRNSRNKGADTLRIEATVANPDLLRVMERVLGKAKSGSGGKFQDAWEITLN